MTAALSSGSSSVSSFSSLVLATSYGSRSARVGSAATVKLPMDSITA